MIVGSWFLVRCRSLVVVGGVVCYMMFDVCCLGLLVFVVCLLVLVVRCLLFVV